MKVDLELSGRRYRASVTAPAPGEAGTRLRVVLHRLDQSVPDEERLVDMRATPQGHALLSIPDGRVVDAAIRPTGPDRLLVQLPGRAFDVLVNGRRQQAGTTGAQGSGEQRICAPMPGRVLRVLVAAGAPVVGGQPLVVIEAMKMENALTASRDGVVSEVAAVEGSSVEAGRLLIRIT